MDEIERRTKARMKKGDAADRVEAGVVDELAGELIEGHGLGLVLRPYESSAERRSGDRGRVTPVSQGEIRPSPPIGDAAVLTSKVTARGGKPIAHVSGNPYGKPRISASRLPTNPHQTFAPPKWQIALTSEDGARS